MPNPNDNMRWSTTLVNAASAPTPPPSSGYDLDDALANWPGAWPTLNRPTLPTVSTTVTPSTSTELSNYLSNTGGNYDNHIIYIDGTFVGQDQYELRGTHKRLVFADGADVSRIVFATSARGGCSNIHAYAETTKRSPSVSWFGPLYDGLYSGYNDIFVDGLDIDINPRFPSWAPEGGYGWDACNRVAIINSHVGFHSYGCVPQNCFDFVVANCLYERTSTATASSSGNEHGIRTEYTSRIAIVDTKIDCGLEPAGAVGGGTALRFHYGYQGGAGAISQYCLAHNTNMEGRGRVQVRADNDGSFTIPYSNATDRLSDVILSDCTYRRKEGGSNTVLSLGDLNNPWPAGPAPYRTYPYNLTMTGNIAYESDSGGTMTWDDYGVSPGDETISGNSSGGATHTEFDSWDYSSGD